LPAHTILALILIAILGACIFSSGCAVVAGAAAGGAAGYVAGHSAAKHENEKETTKEPPRRRLPRPTKISSIRRESKNKHGRVPAAVLSFSSFDQDGLPATTTAAAATAAAEAAAAATTTAATPTTAAEAATTTTATRLTRLGLVDRQLTAIKLGAVHRVDGGPGLVIVAHLDEPEAAAAARVAIGNHCCGSTSPCASNAARRPSSFVLKDRFPT
jgi:hypothetical protein